MGHRAQPFFLSAAIVALACHAPAIAQSGQSSQPNDTLLLPESGPDPQTGEQPILNAPPKSPPAAQDQDRKADETQDQTKPSEEETQPNDADQSADTAPVQQAPLGEIGNGIYLPASPASLADRNGPLPLNDRGLFGNSSLNRYRFGGPRRVKVLGVPILERRHPDYDPLGLKAGGFVIHPVLASTANYTSNVFRQDNGRNDVFAELGGEVVAQSTWSRHQLVLDGLFDQRLFSKYSTEDTTSYSVNAKGRIDVSHDAIITISGEHSRDFRQRNSTLELIQTRRPIIFTENVLEIGTTGKTGRISASINAKYLDRNYHNAELPDGTPFSQAARDYHSWTVTPKIGYEFFQGRQGFISASYENRKFPTLSTPQRDVVITQFLSGIEGDITPLIKGRIGLGYINANFRDVNQRTKGAFTFDAQINYLLTELTTVTFVAERELTNIAVVNSRGAFRTKIGVNVDHELLRNLILSSSLIAQHSDYIDSPIISKGFQSSIGAQYLANRTFRLTGEIGYNRSKNNSDLVPRNTDVFTASLGVAAAF